MSRPVPDFSPIVQPFFGAFPFNLPQMRIPVSRSTGNTIPAKMPILRLSSNALDIVPTRVGPPEHPRSPPSANSANIAVPPLGRAADALLNVPGHMIPTESPQTAQAARLIRGSGIKDIPR